VVSKMTSETTLDGNRRRPICDNYAERSPSRCLRCESCCKEIHDSRNRSAFDPGVECGTCRRSIFRKRSVAGIGPWQCHPCLPATSSSNSRLQAKNPSSSGFTQAYDYIKLIPTGSAPPTLTAQFETELPTIFNASVSSGPHISSNPLGRFSRMTSGTTLDGKRPAGPVCYNHA